MILCSVTSILILGCYVNFHNGRDAVLHVRNVGHVVAGGKGSKQPS